MSELLVYVDDAVLCSVIFDNPEITLEGLRKEILEDQVDDILCFPYKFTRKINGKCIIVGLKQEKVVKAKVCIETQNEEQSIFLAKDVPKKVDDAESHDKLQNETDGSSCTGVDEPPSKQVKRTQKSLLGYFKGPTKSETQDEYASVRERKVKIFTDKEIENSTGMVNTYRKFWNLKAKEICNASHLKTFKAGEIQGAINVAWTLEKTKHLKEEAEKVKNDLGGNPGKEAVKKFVMSDKTIDRNSQRVEIAESLLKKNKEELENAKLELFDASDSHQRKIASDKANGLEKIIDGNLAELRKAQDSLRKALEARKSLTCSLMTIK